MENYLTQKYFQATNGKALEFGQNQDPMEIIKREMTHFQSFISIVKEYCDREGLFMEIVTSNKDGTFVSDILIQGEILATAIAPKKKKSREEVCEKYIQLCLNKQPKNGQFVKNIIDIEQSKFQMYDDTVNYRELLDNYAKKQEIATPQYVFKRKYKGQYKIICSLSDLVVQGNGTSKETARNQAAYNTLRKLQFRINEKQQKEKTEVNSKMCSPNTKITQIDQKNIVTDQFIEIFDDKPKKNELKKIITLKKFIHNSPQPRNEIIVIDNQQVPLEDQNRFSDEDDETVQIQKDSNQSIAKKDEDEKEKKTLTIDSNCEDNNNSIIFLNEEKNLKKNEMIVIDQEPEQQQEKVQKQQDKVTPQKQQDEQDKVTPQKQDEQDKVTPQKQQDDSKKMEIEVKDNQSNKIMPKVKQEFPNNRILKQQFNYSLVSDFETLKFINAKYFHVERYIIDDAQLSQLMHEYMCTTSVDQTTYCQLADLIDIVMSNYQFQKLGLANIKVVGSLFYKILQKQSIVGDLVLAFDSSITMLTKLQTKQEVYDQLTYLFPNTKITKNLNYISIEQKQIELRIYLEFISNGEYSLEFHHWTYMQQYHLRILESQALISLFMVVRKFKQYCKINISTCVLDSIILWVTKYFTFINPQQNFIEFLHILSQICKKKELEKTIPFIDFMVIYQEMIKKNTQELEQISTKARKVLEEKRFEFLTE